MNSTLTRCNSRLAERNPYTSRGVNTIARGIYLIHRFDLSPVQPIHKQLTNNSHHRECFALYQALKTNFDIYIYLNFFL